MNQQPSDRTLKAAAARDRHEKKGDEIRSELHAAILDDLANGVRQADLVRATGYTRERIRQLARDKKPE